MRMRCWQARPIATRVGGAYLLVVSNEDEVLAGSAQGGDGVSLQNLGSFLHDDDAGPDLLQGPSVFGGPCGRHADHPRLPHDALVLAQPNLAEPLGRILIGLLRMQRSSPHVRLVPPQPQPAETRQL